MKDITDFDPSLIDLLSPDEQAQFASAMDILVGGESPHEFIARNFPHEPPPKHVLPILDVMEQARVKPIRICFDMGPGHAKTTTLMRCVAWWLGRSPADLCGYLSYSDSQARDKSSIAKSAMEIAGQRLHPDARAQGHWRTPQGGGLVAKGAQGGFMGKRIPGLLIYDDPYKDVSEARSPVINAKIIERFKAMAFTRLQGGSIIVLHTRYDMDDLIGYILRTLKWDQVNIATVCDEPVTDVLGRKLGEVAWPEKYPYELCLNDRKEKVVCGHDGHLREIRETLGENLWAAMYQGRPRPQGTAIFHEPARFTLADFKWQGKRGINSLDPAATAKTSADFSAVATLAMKGYGVDTRMWVVDMMRVQVEVPELVARARRIQLRTKLMTVVESVSGFKGVSQTLRAIDTHDADGRPLGKLRVFEYHPGSRDKFTRAQPLAAAWNSGRVFIPIDANWADEMIERFQRFTGSGNQPDDEVDACAQGWSAMYRAAVPMSSYGDAGVI